MAADADERGRGLSLAVETIFFSEYRLDMGIPFASTEAIPIVFPAGRMEWSQQEFFARVASLAGLAIGPAGAPDEIENFISLERTVRYRRPRMSDLAHWLRRS